MVYPYHPFLHHTGTAFDDTKAYAVYTGSKHAWGQTYRNAYTSGADGAFGTGSKLNDFNSYIPQLL
jgi:hypothetical protein